jgi:hypothetical protein
MVILSPELKPHEASGHRRVWPFVLTLKVAQAQSKYFKYAFAVKLFMVAYRNFI